MTSTANTSTPPAAGYPVLNELPRVAPEDLGLVRIRSAYPAADGTPAGPSVSSLSAFPLRVLSPVGDGQAVADLLAAYGATRLRPDEGDPGLTETAVYLHLVLKDGSYVAVWVSEGPGDAAVWYRAPGLVDEDSASPHALGSSLELVSLAQLLASAPSPDSPAGSTLPPDPPADFGFVLAYSPGGRSVIDTFSGTFTKDLIRNPEGETITAPLALSGEEMTTVYEALADLDMSAYPAHYQPTRTWSHPAQTYYFRFRASGAEKEIYWEDTGDASSPDALALRALFERIRAMMEAKPGYQSLPPAVGGYL